MSTETEKDSALPISIRDLTKRYGSLYALNSVDLEIKSGEFLTLLGPSGSGKTTLLMAIAGFNRPDAGSIRFGDQEMVLTPPHKRGVGMVFQSYALFPHMSVAENIAFPLKLRGVANQERDHRVNEALETVQLSGLGNRKINQLSGGQRQRVALARAFVFRPRILLMDEPLSALDKKLRERMQIELKQLHRQLGVTTVYVTHDQREALTMSDRIAVIDHGKLMQVDTPEIIYNQPVNPFVADFIGESTSLALQQQGSALTYANQTIGQAPDSSNTSGWLLIVRPERMHVQPTHDSIDDRHLAFQGQISESVFQGDSALLLVTLGDGTELSIRRSTGSEATMSTIRTGESVLITMPKEDVIIVPADPQ